MLRTALGVTLLALAAAFVPRTAGAATEIKIATLAPKGSAWAKATDKAAKIIEEKTQGRVVIKYYYGGTQGDERDFVRKMKLGQIDGAAVTSVGLGLIRENVKAMDVPFLFRNDKEVDHVRSKMYPRFEKEFENAGFVVLGWTEAGWVRLFHSVPINSRADLGSLKMWAWTDDPTARLLFTKMNVSAVPLGVPDVLPSLQTGLINGCYGSPTIAVAFQWYTKVKYGSNLGVVNATAGLVVRKAVMDKLSPEDQQVIRDAGRELAAEITKVVRRDDQRGKKAMEKAGVKFIDYPADLVAEFEQKSRLAQDELAGKTYSRETLDLIRKHIAEVRK